jgi:pimeloyl-ACP methyl ester carboxylesterase
MNFLRRRATIASLLVAILFSAVSLPADQQRAAAFEEEDPARKCLSITGLAKADSLADERRPDGRAIEETTLIDGSSVPILMIHGFTGRSEHRSDRDGNFSATIDLTAVPGQSSGATLSMIGQTQDIGGTSVYTFDYHDISARWVTDPDIAPALAEAIACLSEAHGHPVIAVAHSMGGLALREALAALEDRGKSAAVSDVITLGTPNVGSWAAAAVNGATSIATFFPGAPGTTVAALRSILLLCGQASTRSLENGNLCAGISEQFAGFDSEAGRAMRAGSEEMSVLPPWPSAVNVHALAGDIGLDVTNFSWFGATRDGGRGRHARLRGRTCR